MTKRIADLTCPECQHQVQVPFEVPDPPTLDQITQAINEATKDQPGNIQKVIQDQLAQLQPKETEDHKHKTADEFLDCPECRTWVDKTATRYQVAPKEPEPAEPAFGSIFSTQKEGD